MAQRPVPNWSVVAVCTMLLGTALVLTWQGLALAADGPYYLVEILATGSVFGADPRVLTNVVRQAPVLLGAKAGVTDTHVLTIALGVGQLVFPAAVWAVSAILARRSPLAFAAVAVTAGVCAAATWFCSVSESVTALALTALVAVLLAQRAPWGWGLAALASATSLVLVASYETAVATGAIAALWAFVRARGSVSLPDRAGAAIVAVSSIAAIGVAVAGSFAEQNDSNSKSFLYFVVSLQPTAVYALLGCGALLVGSLAMPAGPTRWAVLTVAVAGTFVAAGTLEVTPSRAYAARGASVIAVVALQILLAALWFRDRRSNAPSVEARTIHRWEAWLPAAFVAVMCATNLIALRDWSRSVDAFRAGVEATDGFAYVDDVVPSDRQRAVWGWTGTSLSLVVRSTPSDGVLVDREPSYVPFPPEQAREQLPDKYVWRR